MRTGIFIATLIVSLIASTQSSFAKKRNYWDPRDVPLEMQKTPTETRAARIVTAAPKMPNVGRSGFCCLIMDVSQDGLPENIEAEYCSSKRFAIPSVNSAKKWEFSPAIIDGKPVRADDQLHLVTFKLTDERGRVIPDKKRLIVRGDKIDFSVERLCKESPAS